MKIPIYKNTFTSYLNSAVRLIQGVLVTRWIIAYLGMNYYGLWALLWTFFVYGILLDFGCGMAAQKYTANGVYEQDRNKYSRIISTIFTFHLLMGGLIALITLGLSCFSEIIFNMPPGEELDYARTCFLLFGFGAAIVFPTGMFPEILVGLQKIYVRNTINVISKFTELLLILLIFLFDEGLITLIIATMTASVLTNIVMGIYVMRALPFLRCRILIDRQCWREIFSFSGYVYMGAVSNLLLNKSSRLIISIFCGTLDVGLFNVSGRIGDLCMQATGQYQENIGPISGALHKRNHNVALRKIIFNAYIFNSAISFILMLSAFILIEPALIALFNIQEKYPMYMSEIIFMSRLFLINMYVAITLRTLPQNFMIMSDRHKFATKLSIGEGIVTLIVNIIVLSLGAPIYSLLYVTMFITWPICIFILLPYMLKYMKINIFHFLWNVYGHVFLSGILPAIYLIVVLHFLKAWPWLCCFVGGSGALFLYIIGYFLLTSRHKRRDVIHRLGSKFHFFKKFEPLFR